MQRSVPESSHAPSNTLAHGPQRKPKGMHTLHEGFVPFGEILECFHGARVVPAFPSRFVSTQQIRSTQQPPLQA